MFLFFLSAYFCRYFPPFCHEVHERQPFPMCIYYVFIGTEHCFLSTYQQPRRTPPTNLADAAWSLQDTTDPTAPSPSELPRCPLCRSFITKFSPDLWIWTLLIYIFPQRAICCTFFDHSSMKIYFACVLPVSVVSLSSHSVLQRRCSPCCSLLFLFHKRTPTIFIAILVSITLAPTKRRDPQRFTSNKSVFCFLSPTTLPGLTRVHFYTIPVCFRLSKLWKHGGARVDTCQNVTPPPSQPAGKQCN